MPTFHNEKNLWGLITEEMAKQANIKNIYSQRCFFTDLERCNEELFINGILSDPILNHARNQIHVANLAVKTILNAIETLKKHPDKIEDVYKIIASIPEIGTDPFETALLNAAELMGSPSDPLGKAFRSFCSIRRHILFLKGKIYSKEEREDKYNQIKNELDMASKLKIGISQIETRYLDKAANNIFNQLFESKEKRELKSDFEQQRREGEDNRKECLKNFLKLFLHQNFIFPNVNLLNKLGEGDYIFNSPNKRKVELNYTDDGLILQVSFFTQKVFDCNSNEVLENKDEDFFVKGVAKYKINTQSYNETGWVAKFDLISSSLECKEKFKAILDTRNILEKFQEFLTTYLEKIRAYITSNQPVSRPKTKFKPIFFVSDTGSSVSKVVISENKEPCGNILDLTMSIMH